MAEITLYKVTSGYTNNGESYAGAEWYLKYETEYVSNGKTRVNWELYKRGRTSTPTRLSSTIELYFSSVHPIVSESGPGLSWESGRINVDPQNGGSNHPHRSYHPDNNTTATKSGSFIISHDASGGGSFKVELKASIYNDSTPVSGGVKTITLSNNKPYTACYWRDNAYVRIEEALQKPGGEITIKWSGASAGTANSIAGFEVYYSINGGSSWNIVNTSVASTDSSVEMTVPNNRGSTITAKVVIKNTQTGFTNPSKTGGSCKINSLPEKPKKIQPSATIVPSLGGEVSFIVEPGKDDDDFGVTVSYSRGEDGEKYKYDNNRSLEVKENTTFYFWTNDGLEYSSECVSCEIIKNSKPEVVCEINGNLFDDTIKIKSAPGGQTNSTYTYGFQYNGVLTTVEKTASESFYIGDIRHHLSKVLANQGGLSQNTTYEYRYWVVRNDGIENSDAWYSSPLNNLTSFTIPEFVLEPGDGPSGYFGTFIEVLIHDPEEEKTYQPLGKINFDSVVERGRSITALTLSRDENSDQFFNIVLGKDQRLTRAMAFDFDNLSFPTLFKPYSESALKMSMSARGVDYGFNVPAEPKFKIRYYNNDTIEKDVDNKTESSDVTWNLDLTPNHLWGEDGVASSVANDELASKYIELIVVNDFGEEFFKTIKLSFDFAEAPIINGFKVCGGASKIKESTLITLAGTIYYYGKDLEFKIQGPLDYNDFVFNQSVYIEPWEKINTGGWQAKPRTYKLETITSGFKQLGPQQATHETNFTIIATSGQQTAIENSSNVTVLRHVAPRIRFTSLKYDSSTGGTLSGAYVVDDYGYDGEGGQVTEVYIKNKNIENAKTYIWSSGQEGFGNFEVKYPAQSGENKDTIFEEAYRNLAPVCTVSYTLNDATSEYSTDILEYLVVYNILPTVAYRQNYLGINTNDPTMNGQEVLSNPALTISAYNNNKMVYLVSSKNSASIDLEKGAMTNFIMDCGSWSNIPGGIVPGGETPAGLAMIAYTGEIGDLLQNRDDAIVITGGGAPKNKI